MHTQTPLPTHSTTTYQKSCTLLYLQQSQHLCDAASISHAFPSIQGMFWTAMNILNQILQEDMLTRYPVSTFMLPGGILRGPDKRSFCVQGTSLN